MIAKPKAEVIKNAIVDKKTPTPKIIVAVKDVVDLHIEKIVANPANLNADEMLKQQLEMFESCLSKAIAAGLPKITFIHGVGGYVLKKMIWLRLKSHKQVKEYKEAPQSQYGNGATEVWFG
jgi:dsDNA-specific endonuclease/ATPase MutS2